MSGRPLRPYLRHEPDAPAMAAAPPVAPAGSYRRRNWWAAGVTTALASCSWGTFTRGISGSRARCFARFRIPRPQSFGAENPDVKVWVNTDSGTYHCPGQDGTEKHMREIHDAEAGSGPRISPGCKPCVPVRRGSECSSGDFRARTKLAK